MSTTKSTQRMDKYLEALSGIPAPGGNGCHVSLLGVSNLGIIAGLPPDRIFEDLRKWTPQGKRHVSDREILDAVNKALTDHKAGKRTPQDLSPLSVMALLFCTS